MRALAFNLRVRIAPVVATLVTIAASGLAPSGCTGEEIPLGGNGRDIPAHPIDMACPTGLTWCGGRCADLSTEKGNCGSCGWECLGSGDYCYNGRCTPPDMSMAADLAPSVCLLPSGRSCKNPFGAENGCASDDGCNWCSCGASWGGGSLAFCSQGNCSDDSVPGAPPWPHCRTQADCPTGYACLFDVGCGAILGRCNSMRGACPHDSPLFKVCGCDGKTLTFTALGCQPDRPYAHDGECP